MNKVRKTVNQVVNEILKEAIGSAMKESALDEMIDTLARLVGDALDKDTFDRYCTSIYREIDTAINHVMNQVFDETEEDNDND